MAWISVWQETDGPKLRKLSKALETCKAEALGILCFLWFWGMNNADETGKVLEADREDIEDALQAVTKINSEKVVDALFSAGWLDERDGHIFLHDWDTWQEQWYKLQRERKTNAERMRRKRSELRERAGPEAPPPEDPPEEPVGKTEAPAPPKEGEEGELPPKPPKKKKYAEFVSMTEEEYGKLIAEYGTIFATACIAELDNYKGSKGKKYKSDYRAILSWVVDRVNEKRPGLLKMSRASMEVPQEQENPFEEYGGQDG